MLYGQGYLLLEFCGTSRMAEASTDFLIPWVCLKENEVVPIKKVVATQGHRKTFAQELGNVTFFCPKLPTP